MASIVAVSRSSYASSTGFYWSTSSYLTTGGFQIRFMTVNTGTTVSVDAGVEILFEQSVGGNKIVVLKWNYDSADTANKLVSLSPSTPMSFVNFVVNNARVYTLSIPSAGSTGGKSISTIPAPTVDGIANGILLNYFTQTISSGANTVTLTGPAGYALAYTQTAANTSGTTTLLTSTNLTTTGSTGEKVASSTVSSNIYAGVSLVLEDYTPPPPSLEPGTARRYYSIKGIIDTINSDPTGSNMFQATDPMETQYGMLFGSTTVTSSPEGDYIWEIPIATDPRYKPCLRANIDSLAKYPPEFITNNTGLHSVVFVINITDAATQTVDVGGLAIGTQFFVDIANYLGKTLSSEYIFHHELQHIIKNTWPEKFTAVQAEWEALNPTGFTYMGSNYNEPYEGTHPEGFVRSYARHSYTEDIAEVHAILFTTSSQDNLIEMLATDPIIAGKVEIMKRVLAEISYNQISGEEYYRAIHRRISSPVFYWDGAYEIPATMYQWDGTTEVPIFVAHWTGSGEVGSYQTPHLVADTSDPGTFVSNLTPDIDDPGTFIELMTADPNDPGTFLV